MADIVGKMDGTVSVGDVVIRFELPNPIGAKKIDVEATDVEEI
jgi:hypothetical protein